MRADLSTPNQGSAELPWLTALLVAGAILLWWGFGPAPAALVFDRAAITQGQIWRLITGHMVHSDAGHALWDIAALAAIGWLLETQCRLRMLLVSLLGCMAVDVGIWWFMPTLDLYCGLSGVLNTLFVVMLADLWAAHRHPIFPLAGIALCIKLAYEIHAGQSLIVATAWPATPLAHLAGTLGGLLMLGAERAWSGVYTTRDTD